MVAGIIVVAAADEVVLSDPRARATAAAAWLLLGGYALYLAGHAAFKAVVWRTVPWSRIAAAGVLALLGLLAPHVALLTLAICAAAVIVAVAVADHLLRVPAAGAAPRAE
jgi:low temperature requirement protein LtrA